MASARTKTQPVGSSGWIQNEREQTAQFVEQEVEEFGYSVRNELEWLNEHVGDIFATNNVTLADVFKTPGKLRGKTPRTARKRDALGTRQPLTDIFAPNVPAPPSAQKNAFLDRVHQFQIADDAENQPPAARPTSRGKSPHRVGKPGNTDSGYHGMTEDEMEVDNRTEAATDYSSQQSMVQKVPVRDNQRPAQRIPKTVAEARDGDSSGDSFMSAKEDLTSRNASKEQLRDEQMDDEMDVDPVVHDENVNMEEQEEEQQLEQPTGEVEAMAEDQDQDQDPDQDAESSTSDVSSPEKPLQRKSSFTFTALPPRDPLGAKRSIGARNSQIEAAHARTSTLGRSFGAKSVGIAQDGDEEHVEEKPEESKAHSKTSTQLLQERINMLGKTKEPRPSKSIAQTALNAQPVYPSLPAASESRSTVAPVDDDDDDDDWIAPTKPTLSNESNLSPARPPMHQKSISTTAIPSPRPDLDLDNRLQKAVSVSNPNFGYTLGEIQSTTPAGSPPSKKQHDGPLSASKSRLYSVLKSAKSIFASSASASAAAKLEAHNTPSKSPRREPSNESKTAAVLNMPGAMYSQQQFAEPPKSPTRSMISLVSKSPSRKTRSSSESDKKREKELKAQQKAADELEKAREKERQKAAKQQEKERNIAQRAEPVKTDKELPRPPTAESEQGEELEQPAQPQQKQQPKSMLPGGKLRAPGRLAKPSRAEPAPPSRPAPVSIRVASQSQRLGQGPSASTLSKSQHENNAQNRPPTAGSIRPGSAQGSVRGSTAPANARVKALEAAQRKKEADERAAQRKLEQKRDLERKRAAKAEDERRAEEEKRAAEQARVQEAKLAAQRQAEKQALEQKRKEEARQEAQRRQEEDKRAKAAQDLAEAIKRERAQEAHKPARGDVGGTLRHLAKHTVPEHHQNRPPQINQAKPPKRVWDASDDEPVHQHPQPPQRPGMQRGPPSYQQHDAKRRRTNEEEPPMQQPARSSVMAPPMRPSAMRKESTLSKFPQGYTHAPPAAPHNTHGHAPSMFKATVTAQHQLQHPGVKAGMANHPSQMVQVSNARIPFAENANGQAPQYYHHPQAGGHENTHPGQLSTGPNKYKTPARPAQAPKSAKSSPLYQNGDNIQLPDIATDSEDEDSEDEDNTGTFRAPSWVASPALRDLLTQQQLVDPETVFGPIGELKMDEVFRGAKNQDRLKRFRDRGSSAAWIESGDAVTSAEKRRDMEMRERVVRDGGWRYEPTN